MAQLPPSHALNTHHTVYHPTPPHRQTALEEELKQLEAAVAAAAAAHADAAARLAARRARLKECDAEIRALEKARDELAALVTDADVERRRLEGRLGAKRAEQGGAADRMAQLEEDFEWIAREKVRLVALRGGGGAEWRWWCWVVVGGAAANTLQTPAATLNTQRPPPHPNPHHHHPANPHASTTTGALWPPQGRV